MQHLACHDLHYQYRHQRNDNAIHQPHIATGHNGGHKRCAGTQPDCRQKERDANLAQHHIGRRGGENYHFIWSEIRNEQRHNERSARQAQLERLRHARNGYRQRAKHHAQGDADEYRHQIRHIEAFEFVAKDVGHFLHIVGFAHHHDAVAQLQVQIRARQQIDAGTIDPRDGNPILRSQIHFADFLPVPLGFRYHNAPRHQIGRFGTRRSVMLIFDKLSQQHQCRQIFFFGQHANRVAYMQTCGGRRHRLRFVGMDNARYH